MKLQIKVKELTPGCMPEIIEKGDWIDLKCAQDLYFLAPQSGTLKSSTVDGFTVKHRDVELETCYIPLGVAIKLPDGYEAIVASRSSTPMKKGLLEPAGFGIIDNTYSGNDDQWCYIATPMRELSIKKGDRICQFRIQLSQKATFWQKLKWLFSSGVELIKVDNLNDESRGGMGSTDLIDCA